MTIVLTVPMLLASIFGMNTWLPFHQGPWGFAAIVGIAVLLVLITVIFFSRKRFF